MADIDKIRADLVRDEGISLAPYKDTLGKLTTGVGRCLDTNPLTTEECAHIGHDGHQAITREQAFYLLENDINWTLFQLRQKLPWFASKDEAVQRALVNVAFQIGVAGLLKFTTTLKCIQMDKYGLAAENLRKSLLYKQTQKRAERVARLIETGTA